MGQYSMETGTTTGADNDGDDSREPGPVLYTVYDIESTGGRARPLQAVARSGMLTVLVHRWPSGGEVRSTPTRSRTRRGP